jgi:ubiquinone biosynthesis protein COQ9
VAKTGDLNKTRDMILVATLSHVAFDGWTHKAVEAGAKDSGNKPEVIKRLFPDGIPSLVNHFADWIDRQMLHEFSNVDLEAMRVRDRITMGVRFRLNILAPYQEGVRRLLSYQALPQNTLQAAKLTWAAVDAIWYAAGDTSSDYNYYTKRCLLASVYSTTVLFWLNDESDGFSDTWEFLDRRIGDVMKIPRLSSKMKKVFNSLPGLLNSFRNLKY